LGSKIGKHSQLYGLAHYHGRRKKLVSRTQLDEPAECVLGGDTLLLYKILHLLYFPPLRILCTLCLGSRKNYQHDLMRDLWNFGFFGRGISHQPVSEICHFVSGS
jgi:hypothetical protein